MSGKKKEQQLSSLYPEYNNENTYIFLCFQADGPKWDNLLQIPAYPSGYSYFRPFRYRDKWIDDDLLKILKDKDQQNVLIGKEAVLCMRFFNNNYQNFVIPIRKVKIIGMDILTDNHSIFFKMDSFFNFLSYNTLSDAVVQIPKNDKEYNNEHLFFISNTLNIGNINTELNEDEIWVKLIDLIQKEEKLPVSLNAKNGIFLRFNTPITKKVTKISSLYKYQNNHEIFGATLNEGISYDLKIYHRIPCLLNTGLPSQLNYFYKSPSENIEFDKSSEEFSGNYQTHFIGITPRRPSGTWEEIIIKPEVNEKKISDDHNTLLLSTNELHIPVKIKKNYWYRTKSYYYWIFLFILLFIVNSILNQYIDFKTNNYALLLSVIVSAIIGIIVFLLPKRTWE